MFEAAKISTESNDWISFVLLSILILLVIANWAFDKRVYHTNTFFFSKKYLAIYKGKEKKSEILFQILLFTVQLLTFSLLFFTIIKNKFEETIVNPFNFFTSIVSLVAIYFFGKYLLDTALSYIFDYRLFSKKIMYEKSSYNINIVLWILPFLTISIYSKTLQNTTFQLTFYLFIILLILRYILLFINNKKIIFHNFFYFILYICALEITPLLIILKLMV